ncbi:MAG: hypothetical protein DI598_17760, partial [Pseudopedobacter saltans]
VKAQGYQAFISKFGVRPNVDNWIRQNAIQSNTNQQNANNADPSNSLSNSVVDSSHISLQYLKEQLLNTPEKQLDAKRKMADSYLSAGKIMEGKFFDFPGALWFYKQAASIDPTYVKNKEELMYRMSTTYFENGDKQAALALREQLKKEYPNSRFLQQTTNNNKTVNTTTSENTAAGKTYANIYNEMIAGEFAKAKADKLKADSIYGSQYWTPQLLYIESIYYVSERQDSTALFKLHTLVNRFVNSPIKDNAETMIRVLSKRAEIEDYLTKLQITRLKDEDEEFVRKGIENDHYEAKLPEKEPIKLKDSLNNNIKGNLALNIPKIGAVNIDTTSKNGIPPYIISLDSPHYVMILLDKVAKVFATETGNAFKRFNNQNYHNQNLGLRSQVLDERYQTVLIGPFKDAGDAFIYIDKVAPITPNRILPWLAKEKYAFTMISEKNLNILLQYKNLEDYKARLHETLPSKF